MDWNVGALVEETDKSTLLKMILTFLNMNRVAVLLSL